MTATKPPTCLAADRDPDLPLGTGRSTDPAGSCDSPAVGRVELVEVWSDPLGRAALIERDLDVGTQRVLDPTAQPELEEQARARGLRRVADLQSSTVEEPSRVTTAQTSGWSQLEQHAQAMQTAGQSPTVFVPTQRQQMASAYVRSTS